MTSSPRQTVEEWHMLTAATTYVSLGFSVIPVVADGSKRPATPWSIYQRRAPEPEELHRWFASTDAPHNMGVVCGMVSGGLEVLDFDDPDAWAGFKAALEDDEYLAGIVARCPVIQTPRDGGGYHLLYRVEWPEDRPAPGSIVLARDANRGVRIETRGEGSYIQTVPTPGYIERHLSIEDTPTITLVEREALHNLARAYHDYVEPYEVVEGQPDRTPETPATYRPGDDYNDRGDIIPLLVEHGWVQVGFRKGVTLWRRPGKAGVGPSATQGVGGKNLFYVFSSNAAPFQPHTAYSYFAVYAILVHGGDFKAAAQALAARGYGEVSLEGVDIAPGVAGCERILPLASYVLPEFPSDTFPGWAADMVNATSLSTQAPVDLPSMLLFSVAATALAKRVEMVPRPDWREPVNLYTLCALPPGGRKTSVFKGLIDPLSRYEDDLNAANERAIAEYEDRRNVLTLEQEAARKAAAKASDLERPDHVEKLARIREEMADLEARAASPVRLLADDSTPEHLARLLAENGGRVSILSDDTDVFEMMAGRYNGGTPNLDVYLKAHSAGCLKVGRVGRVADVVTDAALTIGLAVQPQVLQGLIAKPGFRGRGLLGRWFFSLPEDNTGYRDLVDVPAVRREVADAYSRNITRLLTLPPRVMDDGTTGSHRLRFEPDAERRFWYWAQTIEHRMRPGSDLEDLKDWASKLHGLVARVAALLHVLWHVEVGGGLDLPVGLDTLERALRVGQYAIAHAKAAFAEMGADDRMNKARRILNWLKRTERLEFSRRQAQQAMPTIFPLSSDLAEPLKLLIDRGYLGVKPDEKTGPGRKSERYVVNPSFYVEDHESGVRQVPFEDACGTDPISTQGEV